MFEIPIFNVRIWSLLAYWLACGGM